MDSQCPEQVSKRVGQTGLCKEQQARGQEKRHHIEVRGISLSFLKKWIRL